MLAISVRHRMALLTEGDQVGHAMGLGSLAVVNLQMVGCSTPDTAKTIAHFGPQFPFRTSGRISTESYGLKFKADWRSRWCCMSAL